MVAKLSVDAQVRNAWTLYRVLHIVAFGYDPGAEAYFKQDMAEGVKSVTLDTDEVNGSGDWCFERGHYRLDGSRGSETGS